MVAEKLFTQGNAYTGGKKTRFSCIRYGNVVGSRGSVIPLFKEQKKNGVITITDDRMTRFWITLGQGVRFVMDCIARMKGGETFVPKIPSMKVIDLAKVIAPDAERKVIGIRSGEKLHEILLTEDEARHTREFDNYFVIEPEHPFWDKNNFNDEKSLPEGFRYTSDGNDKWLTEDEIGKIVDES
jgi:FlaA1/EpsC-like NDP-sugar epimerase